MNITHRSRAALTAAALLATALTVGGCDKASGKYLPYGKDGPTFVFKSDKLDITEKQGFGADAQEVTLEFAYTTDGDRVIVHGAPGTEIRGLSGGASVVLTVQDNGDITGFPGVRTLVKTKD